MKTVTTEEIRATVVSDLERRIATREENKPTDKDALSVHEFGTRWIRNELRWIRGIKLPFELHDDGDMVQVEILAQ
jgi:hypothetical protein